jgi:hypothetical protein
MGWISYTGEEERRDKYLLIEGKGRETEGKRETEIGRDDYCLISLCPEEYIFSPHSIVPYVTAVVSAS